MLCGLEHCGEFLPLPDFGSRLDTDSRREKILSLLSLPPTTLCEYRSNKALLDAASSMNKLETPQEGTHHPHATHQSHGFGNHHQQGFQHSRHQQGFSHHGDRGHFREPRGPRDDSRTGGWSNGFRRDQQPL